MDHEPPAWADELEMVMGFLAKRGPQPLLPRLNKYTDVDVSAEELSTYLRDVDDNDPVFMTVRRTLGKWDREPATTFTDPDISTTPCDSPARRQAICAALALDEHARAVLATRVRVPKKRYTMVSKQHEIWYPEALRTREQVYWNDYETYLREIKGWKDTEIEALDQSTRQIMERLCDPTREKAKRTKGLVVGYVQSGKTASFTGLAAKAIDAGYRLVIVLTGTIEILRAQTQRRMDMELVGVENILDGQDPDDPRVRREIPYLTHRDWTEKFVRHGSALGRYGVAPIIRATVHQTDYQRLSQGLTKLRYHRHDPDRALNDPVNLFRSSAYLAVVKKQKDSLAKLIADLTPLRDELDELPVLIIDDESDQASLDTSSPAKRRAGKRTMINKLITDLLELCLRAQYVGYTATPFANVFVDPNDPRDLFPSDFVLSLDAPRKYMGLKDFHDVDKDWEEQDRTWTTSNEMAYVRALKGDPDTNPKQRDSELSQALDAWVLTGAIKLFREARSGDTSDSDFRHHTMLVHESSSTDDHSATAGSVRRLWATARFNSAVGVRRLEKLYDDDILPVMRARADGQPIPESFSALKPYIADALAKINIDQDPILIVNSDKEIQKQAKAKRLDFDADPVWRILIGGAQLSRGFTIEGLTVSYFRRKAGQGDTLMQAGRWFGFRPGYRDLVRLYIRRDEVVDLYAEYEALLVDEDAFRIEIKKFEGVDDDGMPLLEPRKIPPLVRQTLPWLPPTARNKRWNSFIVSRGPTRMEDRYGLPLRDNRTANHANLIDVGVPLLAAATHDTELTYTVADQSTRTFPAKVGIITAAAFLPLFEKLQWHPSYDEVIRPFRRFLDEATADATITEWAIIWPQPTKCAGSITVPGLGCPAPIVTRSRRDNEDRHDFSGSDAKHRNAAETIARGKISIAGHGPSRSRGAILVYLVDDRSDNEKAEVLHHTHVVPLLSMAAPMDPPTIQGKGGKRNYITWSVRVESRKDDVVVDDPE